MLGIHEIHFGPDNIDQDYDFITALSKPPLLFFGVVLVWVTQMFLRLENCFLFDGVELMDGTNTCVEGFDTGFASAFTMMMMFGIDITTVCLCCSCFSCCYVCRRDEGYVLLEHRLGRQMVVVLNMK